MNVIGEIQSARNQAIREIDEIFYELIQRLGSPSEENVSASDEEYYDIVYPLDYNLSEFKGRKPTSIIFGREKVGVGTWTAIFAEIMKRCNANIEHHRALMNLRNRVSGRTRAILSDKPDGMRTPLRIDNKLYAETHYDTATLMHILLHRILKPAGYDYRDIYVALRHDI